MSTYTTQNIGGKVIHYDYQTTFIIQIAKGKQEFLTCHKIRGNFEKAVVKMNLITISHGWTKRIVMKGRTLVQVVA